MMSVNSSAVIGSIPIGYVVVNAFFVLVGSLDFVSNAAIAFAVFSTARLRTRKECCIYGAFTAADSLCGLAYLASGARRLYLYALNETKLITPMECMQGFPINIFIFSLELVSLMLLAVSVDRLIFITNMNMHFNLGATYLPILIGSPIAIALTSLAAGWVVVEKMPNLVNQNQSCLIYDFAGDAYFLYHSGILILASSSAVALYLLIMILFRFRANNVSQFDSVKQKQILRQQQLTTTLSLMVAATFVTFVLPNICLTFTYRLVGSPTLTTVVSQSLATVLAMHSAINATCFLSRPSDIRKELVKLVFCNKCARVRPSTNQDPGGVSIRRSVR